MTRFDPIVRHVVFAVVLSAVAALSWFQGVRRIQRMVQSHRATIDELTQRVGQTEAMVATAGGLDEWLVHHNQRLQLAQARIQSEERLPRLLNELAKQWQAGTFQLGTITPGNPELVMDAQGQPVLIAGAPCVRLPVTIQGRGRYHALLQLLEDTLNASVPPVARLDELQLKLLATNSALLDINVRLSLYLVREASQVPDA